MLRLVTLFALVTAVSGCSTGSYSDTPTTEALDDSQTACEDQGLAWVGGERGCLSPTEIETWQTSGCGDQDYYTCEELGFPDFWDMPQNRGASTPPWADVEVGSADDSEARWTCSYSPTYDRDWHNDVLCTNGVDTDRPYLREWDSFVEEAEIMESAAEYERQLNGD